MFSRLVGWTRYQAFQLIALLAMVALALILIGPPVFASDLISDPTPFATFLDSLGVPAGIIALISVLAAALARMIPDTATGLLGLLRKLMAAIGLKNTDRKDNTDPIA